MKLTIHRSRCRSLIGVAVSARVFLGLSVELAETGNAAWLCALFGAALSAPILLLVERAYTEALHSRTASLLLLVPGALLALDAAGQTSLLALAVDYATMTSLRPVFLIVPLAVALYCSLLANGDGVTGAARLWLRALPLLAAIVLCQHAGSYRFRWLAPLFGPGGKVLARGVLASMGWTTPGILLWLIADAEGDRPARGLLRASCLGLAASSALLLLHAAMTPTQAAAIVSHLSALDSLLSNGRATIATQLPMTVLLIAGQLVLLAEALFVIAALIQRILPRLDGHVCLLLACAGTTALSLSRWADVHPVATLKETLFPFIPTFAGLCALQLYIKNRRQASC